MFEIGDEVVTLVTSHGGLMGAGEKGEVIDRWKSGFVDKMVYKVKLNQGDTFRFFEEELELEEPEIDIPTLDKFGQKVPKWLQSDLQPGPPAGSGFSKEFYECSGCGYITYEGYKKDKGKETLGKGFICPQCGDMTMNPLEDKPPMSARDRYAKR